MTTEQALNDRFVADGVLDPGATRDGWYAGHWIRLRVHGARVPFFPILRRGGPIILHDVHHMLTGYGFSWRGELEVAAWELGSGGCGWHVLYWLDRLTFFALGLVFAPRVTLQAFARGRRGHNLFARDPEEVLRMDVDAARASVGASSDPR